jgi:hypothetical protein
MGLPTLHLESCEETSIYLTWDKEQLGNNAANAVLEWKLALQSDWSNVTQVKPDESLGSAEIMGLEPGTPYSFRLRLGGEEGPAATFDTMPMGCTPKERSCCTLS